MHFFSKQVDMRSRHAMVGFLENHFRYQTMNSWNKSSSYASVVKINQLGLNRDQLDKAFEFLDIDFWDDITAHIEQFTSKMQGRYTIGQNGRSGGYLVLYEANYEGTGHKSFCRTCGQRNFKRVAPPLLPVEAIIAHEILRSQNSWRPETYLNQEAIKAIEGMDNARKIELITRLKRELSDCALGNRCGVCGAEGSRGRINYAREPQSLCIHIGRSIDQNESFEDWSMNQLRQRVLLVRAFDEACDQIRDTFIDLITSNDVVEETVMVPTKVKVISPHHAASM